MNLSTLETETGEFEANMVYTGSSRKAKATQWGPASKAKQNNKLKKNKTQNIIYSFSLVDIFAFSYI